MTELTGQQLHQLMAPLNPNRVANRKQGGATLSYVEAWDVRATMIRLFGFGGWSADVTHSVVHRIDEVPSTKDPSKKNFRVLAQVTVRVLVLGLGCSYTETAAASQIGPDIGEVTDFSLKTAASDAFKRACMNLGTQMGLSLYDSGNTQDVVRVVLEPAQRQAIIDHAEEQRKKAAEKAAAVADTGANPATGEVPDDEPTPPSEAAIEDATAKARAAFQRS